MHSKSNSVIAAETPNSASDSTSPSGSTNASQDLWWTERLVLEAQQEFPGELGEGFFLLATFFLKLVACLRRFVFNKNENKEYGRLSGLRGVS